MPTIGELEARTQKRVTEFFRNALGYRYLGFWKERDGNSNVEADELTKWLKKQGHDDNIITRTLRELDKAASLGGSKTLYDANREVYGLLRYGVKIKPDIGEQTVTVWLIDWGKPDNNDFAIAEEVTVLGQNTKRPDIVLYVNGVALGVLELKRSIVSVTEGIRQNLDSQKADFIEPFFSTMQLVMAGNETEGLRYGMIKTPEKYYLRWKEAEANPAAEDNALLRELGQLCRKDRLLEIVHDFLVYDAGVKKVARHNQYFGVRAAQQRVRQREGGIIWHTQGSGKTLTMIWLAKWLYENVKDARVLMITDRKELDEQIETRFLGVDEDIYRTKSGDDLVRVLNANEEWLICSLIHKFGSGEELSEKDLDEYLKEIKRSLPKNFQVKGNLFVFVDECHRTQSGKLHEAMKALLPGAMFIGFTGTPLLSRDKKTSIETFGSYIHTYKYDEAVADKVVLDLRYEARDIDQNITSQANVDKWFEAKTKGLTDLAKAQLKKRWGTMQNVLSSQSRLEKIAMDIQIDMATRDRLSSDLGNALLVSDSIYAACRLFEMFQKTDLKGKCAIVTSYRPTAASIKGEESGEGQTQQLLQYEVYRRMLADHFNEPEDAAAKKVEDFEKQVKQWFTKEPGRMKLLIVVDKLLTGFDAPPATYLYIDKQMRDHGLFQAICRVNRLDGDDKEYGFIIDYQDLFKSLEKSIKDYTGEALDGYDKDDVAGLLEDRLQKGRERLEELREEVKALCERVESPRDSAAFRRFFCTPISGDADALKANEPKRVALYKLVGSLVRAYANLANEMAEAGYSEDEARDIKEEVAYYQKVRDEVRLSSGDYVDMKMYEPAMRQLLDNYIRAEESEQLSTFDNMSLVDLIVSRGEEAVKTLPKGIRGNQEAMAETIENNVRRLIIDESAVNPKYYDKMSELLDALIQSRREEAMNYRAYLAQIVELARKVKKPETETSYPAGITTAPQRALFDNLDGNAELAIELDDVIWTTKRAGWRGQPLKERELRGAIKAVLDDDELVDRIFEIVKNQRDY